MLKVWGRRSSFNVQKVLWLVGELGLAHEHIPAGGSFGRLDEPDFRALNPHGRVPIIEGGVCNLVWNPHAILRYLAAQYGHDNFWADDPATRARVEGWMDWSQTAPPARLPSTASSGDTTALPKRSTTGRRFHRSLCPLRR